MRDYSIINELIHDSIILSLFFTILFSTVFLNYSIAEDQSNNIVSISSIVSGDSSEIRLTGNEPLVSTIYELPNPNRIIVDIANTRLDKNFRKPSNFPFKFVTNEIKISGQQILRFEIIVPNLITFKSNKNNNDTIISITTKDIAIEDGNKKTLNFTGIKIDKQNSKTIVHICADEKIVDFSKEIIKKNKNPQLIININNISINDQKLGSQSIKSNIENITTSKTNSGIQVILTSALNSLFHFSLYPSNSGLDIIIDETDTKDQISNILSKNKNIENQLPKINLLNNKPSLKNNEQQIQDTFNFSGYDRERITVEFQKMDLHNVFNFLRQVSGFNIVVDESVNGSLTLILDNVPWDFALDIILNLKGLEKEERFNTLVIYPKGKGFSWPKQAKDNLSFKANLDVIEKEALIIQQQEKQSPEIVEAKEIISQGREAEKKEAFETAVQYYERALEKWPENIQLANRVSEIYLVQLGQNVKSMYFAQRALTINPKDQIGLLHAAIASANMQDTAQAEKFFNLGIQTKNPLKETYLNYATFKERRKSYQEALSLLNQHNQLYGKTLDSMIASARIYDKLGDRKQADQQYRIILTSGFRIPIDLKKFIQERIAH